MGVYKLRRIDYLDEFTSLYPTLRQHVTKALTKAPEYSEADVIRDVLCGNSHIWVCHKDTDSGDVVGIVTTCINKYPQATTMLIHLLGGKGIHEWVDQIEEIEKYAKDLQCNSIEIHGRPAWKKLLPSYHTERIILNKEL